MAEWSPDARLVKWIRKAEARRQSRLVGFLRPHLQPDERIVTVFSQLTERLSGWRAGLVALVVTNQRLLVIRLGGMSSRPKEILVTLPSDGLTFESNPNERKVRGAQYGWVWYGKLTVTGFFGAKEFWVGEGMRDCVHGTAKMLEDDLRRGQSGGLP